MIRILPAIKTKKKSKDYSTETLTLCLYADSKNKQSYLVCMAIYWIFFLQFPILYFHFRIFHSCDIHLCEKTKQKNFPFLDFQKFMILIGGGGN